MSGYTAAVAVAAAVAGTAYSAYSSVQTGKQAALNADAQSEQAQDDANTAASAAEVQAARIRRLGRTQQSQANASLAASGIDVGEGSAININQDIVGNSEEDAALTVFNGRNQASKLNTDASNYQLAGAQAQSSANSSAFGSVLNGAAAVASGWKATASGVNKQGQGNALNTNAAWVSRS